MKALDILKRICNHGSATVIEIKESIEELEALENRSCENCNCNINKARCDECSMNFNNLWESKC